MLKDCLENNNKDLFTLDIDEAVKEAYGSEFEECCEVFESHFEWISVVQLKVHVNVQA